MFNNFKKFGILLLVPLCINTVNASNNINRNTFTRNNSDIISLSNIEVIQKNIMNFISTCNNEYDFTIGQKSILRNIVNSINNFDTNNYKNISLVALEDKIGVEKNLYALENIVNENKYKYFLNCLDICSEENIISKEKECNVLKILLESNIMGLVDYFSYGSPIMALERLYESLQQLSTSTSIFNTKINKEFINKYWTWNFKTFKIIRKIASNILKFSSNNNSLIFKDLKNNYDKNKEYSSKININFKQKKHNNEYN